MLSNITKDYVYTKEWYTLDFLNNEKLGRTFPCDKNGNLLYPDDEVIKKDYNYAISHPEEYPKAFNKITDRSEPYYVRPTGTCDCGETVILAPDIPNLVAVRCKGCSKWYNSVGEEVPEPERKWIDDPDD